MKKNSLFVVFTLVVLLALVGTGCPLVSDLGEGSLLIQFPAARGGQPSIVWDTDLDMDMVSYTISGSGPLEETFIEEDFTEESFTKDGLAVGEWDIVIDGYNVGGDCVGTVTLQTTILKSQTSTVNADLAPLTGEGTLEVSVSWTDSESKMANPHVFVTLRDENGDDIDVISTPVELTVDGQTASTTIPSLPTGWYEVTLELQEEVPAVPDVSRMARMIPNPPPQESTFETVWGGIYTARIVKEQTTSGSVTVTEDLINFGVGNIDISIGEDMQHPLAVSFTYSPTTVMQGEAVTLTSTGLHSDSANYRWYMNGTKVGTGTPLEYTFTEAGACMVSLLVLDGGALSGHAELVDVAPSLYDIYVAGQTYDATADEYLACYWKNGIKTVLGEEESDTAAIAVIGADVYVAGDEYDATADKYFACYWKNGEKTVLGVTDSDAYAIAVIGADVYVAGYEYDATADDNFACYWKNGDKTVLGVADSEAYAFTVNGADVYVAGYEYDATADDYLACYWKNGEKTVLGSADSKANAIAVIGADVYVAGNELNSSYVYEACYWKNGNQTVLGSNKSSGNALAVIGENVYVAGYERNSSSVNEACYWKDGIKTVLGSTTSYAKAIAVIGEDVFVAGMEVYDSLNNYAASYWKNGVMRVLGLTDSYGNAMAIIVKD